MATGTLATSSHASSQQVMQTFEEYVIGNYIRYPISLVRGAGSRVQDAEGREYLDLFPGWGCNILGYCPPRVVAAIQEQAAQLIHVPNTWYTEAQGEFARCLSQKAFGKAFFCNSGAEAIEAAIKLARLHAKGSRHQIVTFERSFHGRTYGALSATAQPKYHREIGPMLPGFRYCAFNDLAAVEQLLDDQTAAILIEPIQGEGGVNLPEEGFLQGLRELADKNGCLLIFDEVQTGMGRTGTWFAHQQFDVQPDIMTMAKGIASGVACGGILAQDHVAASLVPGMHASTFGGNPLAMSAGIATVQSIEDDNLLEHSREMAARFRSHFEPLLNTLPIVADLRIRGMMIGIELTLPATPVVAKCMERGLLVNATQETVVRLLPALNITPEDVDLGSQVLIEVLQELADEAAVSE